jgi:putative phage-type endonuclease
MDIDNIKLDQIFNKYYDQGFEIIKENVHALQGNGNIDDKFIFDRIVEIKAFRKQLRKLSKIPVIEQRSDEWYDVRQQLITASDFGQCCGVGKFGNLKDIYRKKCGYEIDSFGTGFMAPLIWGQKYEDIATAIYEHRQSTHINPFGLVKHPTISFFGASPDGITDNGIMLEIKCPYKRKIDGHIVDQYLYQMQGQLAVCALNECDFLECAFKEYIDEDDFWEDLDETECFSEDLMEKGIVLHIHNHSEKKYIYSKIYENKKAVKTWLDSQLLLYKDYECSIDYFKLMKYNLQKVYRDKTFFEEKIIELEEVWNKIVEYRCDKIAYEKAVEKRIVKKRAVKCLFSLKPEEMI